MCCFESLGMMVWLWCNFTCTCCVLCSYLGVSECVCKYVHIILKDSCTWQIITRAWQCVRPVFAVCEDYAAKVLMVPHGYMCRLRLRASTENHEMTEYWKCRTVACTVKAPKYWKMSPSPTEEKNISLTHMYQGWGQWIKRCIPLKAENKGLTETWCSAL